MTTTSQKRVIPASSALMLASAAGSDAGSSLLAYAGGRLSTRILVAAEVLAIWRGQRAGNNAPLGPGDLAIIDSVILDLMDLSSDADASALS